VKCSPVTLHNYITLRRPEGKAQYPHLLRSFKENFEDGSLKWLQYYNWKKVSPIITTTHSIMN